MRKEYEIITGNTKYPEDLTKKLNALISRGYEIIDKLAVPGSGVNKYTSAVEIIIFLKLITDE